MSGTRSIKVGAGWMMVSGVLTVIVTIALAFVSGLSLDAYATLCAVAFASVLTVGMVVTFRYMDTL